MLALLGRTGAIAFLASRSGAPLTQSYSSTTSLGAVQYLLKYDYIPEVLEKRGAFREGHIALAMKLVAEGKCLSGGATAEPGVEVPTGALFIFTDEEAAKLFVKEDPYVSNGIVTSHSIQEWNVVVQKE
jgi:uncharacterized protein YciI